MLIEFSVANFLSFNEKQTLTLVADCSKELETTNTLSPTGGKAKLPRLLPSVGIYGANAAGKSNLLRAIKVMRKMILSSAQESQVGEPLEDIIPHALFADQPTEFEIIFIVDGVRYQYGFAATRDLIAEEWLFAFPFGRPQRWLSRVYDMNSKEYSWSINASQIRGQRKRWELLTRNNALFLSTAAQFNSKQLTPILKWFRQNLEVSTTDEIPSITTLEFCENFEGKPKVLELLNTADISVKDFELIEKSWSMADLPDELPLELKEIILQDFINKTRKLKFMPEVKFLHQTSVGKSFLLPLEQESSGTRRLFENAGVWLNVLDQGRVLCVDELASSLHPFMTIFLVSLFHNPDINQRQAQLIFTTHDTNILDNDLLRRDQIWLVEKDSSQSTRLYPVSDFKPQKKASHNAKV